MNFLFNDLFKLIFSGILDFLILIVPLLIAVAYLTLFERKIISAIQRRKGPNVVGFGGLLQPLADGVKLFLKETIIPVFSNRTLFILAPILTFVLSLVTWCVIPFNSQKVFADLNLGILYLFAISSLGVYGIIIAGWSSNSKYAFLGALRSAAQMISYEVCLGLIVMTVMIADNSFNLIEIVEKQDKLWHCIPLFPSFIMFIIAMLAETNRPPFDLPEAEAELVSGYNVEYSAMTFALFFLGEYANMIVMSAFATILFLGGWQAPFFLNNLLPGTCWFVLKMLFFLFFFIWVRASLPRYRYDQLMTLGWKVFLPIALGNLLFCISSIYILSIL